MIGGAEQERRMDQSHVGCEDEESGGAAQWLEAVVETEEMRRREVGAGNGRQIDTG